MKCLSPIFLTQNASVLQWSFALLALDLIVGGFFANQGYWELESRAAETFFNILSAFLYLCAVYRIVRPNGAEHAQVMMFLLLIPKSDIALNFFIQQILIVIVVLQPLLNRFQIYSLVLIVFTALPSMLYLNGLSYNTPIEKIAAALSSPTATTKNGRLVSSTDQIYQLYFFEKGDLPPTYRLLRIIQVCPGLSLVKEIDEMTSAAPVQVTRSEAGKYRIANKLVFQ
ncbi:MAG: hypothetical protein WC714_27065 [Candidatus Obscuribacterales bacterium]